MILRTIFFIAFVIALSSCNSDPGCGEPIELYEHDIIITLVDNLTGKGLIQSGLNDGIYDPSKVNVYLNNQLTNIQITRDIHIDNWLDKENINYETIIKQIYLLELVTYDNIINYDTLNLSYSIIQGKCRDEVEFMEIWYNNDLKYSGKENFFHTIRI